MSKNKRQKQHNYMHKILYLQRVGMIPGKAGDVSMVDVAHDDFCGIFGGRRCDCNPDVKLKWSQPAAGRN